LSVLPIAPRKYQVFHARLNVLAAENNVKKYSACGDGALLGLLSETLFRKKKNTSKKKKKRFKLG
jgi:hypothetical protein